MLFQIAGGIALILFGVRFLRKALDRLFGSNLAHWLQTATRTRTRAFAGGCAIACVAPSSTTMALITLDLLRAGRVPADRLLAVMLGANVGITVMVQLLSLDIYSYSAVFLVAGLIGFQFLTRPLFRGTGQLLLSLGFIFLAMEMISRAASAVSGNADLVETLAILSRHPITLTLAATVLTMALQSSTAVIGLAIALAEGGLGGAPIVIAVVLGANLGTAGTAVISSWSELPLRRTATANLLLKAFPVGILLATASTWMPWLTSQNFAYPLLGANLHTGLNLVVAAVGLAFLNPILKFMRVLLPDEDTSPASPTLPSTYLDSQSLAIPTLALAHASREILLMADTVQAMVTGYDAAQSTRNATLARGIREQDNRVDQLNAAIKEYLSQVNQESLSPGDSKALFALLTTANELESIGDIVDKNLCDHLIKQIDRNFSAPLPDRTALTALHQKLTTRFILGVSLLTTQDSAQAAEFVADRNRFDQDCRAAQNDHFIRLVSSDRETLEASAFFLDCLTSFRQINAHLANLAYAVAKRGDVTF